MDGVQSELRRGSGRGELFAGDCRYEPTNDLDEPRAARVDDAGVAQDVELLGSSCERGLSPREHSLQQLAGSKLARNAALRPPPPSRG